MAANARAKVDATLPEALRVRAAALRERFHLDAPGWFARPEPLDALPAVAEAVWEGRRLDLRYGKDGTRRRVDPLGLVLKGGTWYLVARHRADVRTSACDRTSPRWSRTSPAEGAATSRARRSRSTAATPREERGECASFSRLAFLALIVIGVAGLRLLES